jgi:hypothetical protein
MFERNKLPPLTTDTEMTAVERQTIRDIYRRHTLALRLVGTLAVTEVLLSGLYEIPVMVEKMYLSDTKPHLEYIAPMPEGANLETIVIGGYGVRDSSPIAHALPELAKIGGVEALEQDNTGIDPYVIAQDIIEQAKKQHATRVGLWGDSVGGIIATKIARIIQEDDSPLTVNYIVLDCTPTNVQSLRPAMRKDTAIWQDVSRILPNIAEDPLVTQFFLPSKPAVQTGSHLGIQSFIGNLNNPEIASTALLSAEAMENVDPNLDENLKAISNVSNKEAPRIFTIRPLSNSGDEVVISSLAIQELTHMTTEDGLQQIDLKLAGISHGDPTANQTQYDKALKEIIVPAVNNFNYLDALYRHISIH